MGHFTRGLKRRGGDAENHDMSTMTEQRSHTTTVVRRRRRHATVVPAAAQTESLQITVPQRSNTTGIVFLGLLGIATLLGLVGVVAQAEAAPATGPADAPPAVFVQVD